MNAYYLVNADQVELARDCAPIEGLPHQLFSVRWNNDHTKAIVQADWIQTPPGIYLGSYVNGEAEQAVYDELTKPEWQTPAE